MSGMECKNPTATAVDLQDGVNIKLEDGEPSNRQSTTCHPSGNTIVPDSKEILGKNSTTEKDWCRLCMSEENLDKSVLDQFDEDNTIIDAIRKCIPLMMIRETDELSKKMCTHCLKSLKFYYKFRENCLKMDRIQKGIPKRKSELGYDGNEAKRSCNNEVDNETEKKSEIDAKFDRIEEELRQTLEGTVNDDEIITENIIIQVESDEDVSDEKAPKKVNLSEIKLPKGIRVTVPEKFESKMGTFPSKTIRGIFNNEFCLVDKYLFEYRLCKGTVRYLKCLVRTCAATGRQNMFDNGTFEDKVTIKCPHNHPQPNEDDFKKQMFLHVMKKRMQCDKALNFRSVYDELCEREPEIKSKLSLRSVINEICRHQLNHKPPTISTFVDFFNSIESDSFQKLHFTHSNRQFYQEKFIVDDGSMALVFANCDSIEQAADSKIMYVDASFRIDTHERFKYHLVTILVWVDDSYYPILFSLISDKSQDIYKAVFSYLHDTLAPTLRPDEIVTDYEANLYYALGETYLDSHIGGSVFYYTQNLYKKICALNLSRDLETSSCFRNIYHMVLMLPLLPVNTILDGLNNIEQQAHELDLDDLTKSIFEHVRKQWIDKVTPDLFCVHRLENRINENVIAPFKKLRDFLMLSKGKMHKSQITIVSVVEKLIELENFLRNVYSAPSKKSFARDLSSSQKKNVIRAWQFIESHPKININNFFTKVLGYIKCMENQLWIWGFYRYSGDSDDDELINAANFSIVNSDNYETNNDHNHYAFPVDDDDVVLDVVVDQHDGFLVKDDGNDEEAEDDAGIVDGRSQFQNAYMKYVSKS